MANVKKFSSKKNLLRKKSWMKPKNKGSFSKKDTYGDEVLEVASDGEDDDETTREASIFLCCWGFYQKIRLAVKTKQNNFRVFKNTTEGNQHTRRVRSDFEWVRTVLNSGTLADKVAAYTLLIQDSPVHNLSNLDSLIAMVNTKGKRECMMAIDSLRDLFLSDLLLEDRKLCKFEQHPLTMLEELSSGNREARDRRLLLWYFEDQLKERYNTFVRALEKISHDTVEKTKQKAITTMSELLTQNPEQEQFLLSCLVNKIGDPVHRVAARIPHLLGNLLSIHPNMKKVVAEEVERLLYRPNISSRAQYYALCFLNQMVLCPEDNLLADHLQSIYFGFFKACVKKGEVDTKMMSALLSGVSRSYPYTTKDKSTNKLTEQLDTIYRVVHFVSFNISVQALMLIFQVLDSREEITDRFYTALYRKLLDPQLHHSSHQAMFLNLLYRALKKDPHDQRAKAFMKRLLQVCQYHSPTLVCGMLILISELLRHRPELLSSKGQPKHLSDDEEEEHYEDVPEEEPAETFNSFVKDTEENSNKKEVPPKTPSSWIHRSLLPSEQVAKNVYDSSHRNPLFAGAEYCSFWELLRLSQHFHPSVALFARQILNNSSIDYSGDPLQDFTLIRFLDRFVYRNPKKGTEKTEKDEQQRVFGRRTCYVPKSAKKLPVNTAGYLQQKQKNIPVEERFFYEYFCKHRVKKSKAHDDSDVESVASDEFEKYVLEKFEPGGKTSKIDFAQEVNRQKQKSNTKKKKNSDEDMKNDDDLDSLENEDFDFNDDVDFQNAFKEFDDDLEDNKGEYDEDMFDEENAAFSEDDPDLMEFSSSLKKPANRKRKHIDTNMRTAKRKNKSKSFNTSELFADAEEFSNILDENVGSNVDSTTAEAMANKDNAHAKQLLWESKRDKWIKGKDWKSKRRMKPKQGDSFRRGNFSKKQRYSSKNSNRRHY
ncbi:CCAAT/enhancer-binding protein zeta-like [Limulus polyphemus]|uniref:CCAAT/enhancer-binding protein zeta-like n=1 Tax=Limulus polyphemus TaxID=6850 RepID=A0ABM1SF92_LIMPO|nr:CCAAT/enhancer-binding protein zeta-like [Limulus polyphemus]